MVCAPRSTSLRLCLFVTVVGALTTSCGKSTSGPTPPPLPSIVLRASNLSFTTAQGGPNPAPQTVNVTNGGGGTLGGLAVGTISYGNGQPTGWLSANLSGSAAPATLTLNAVTGTLGVGPYTASVLITSSAANNSPQTESVTFVVSPPPLIALNPSSITVTAVQGGTNPAPQTVNVTNGGGSTLGGLAVGTISYGNGQPTGWLSASLSGSAAPATLTLNAVTGTLGFGPYTATVPITSSVAANSPGVDPIWWTPT
jgi:hypothetical protein